MNFGANLKSIDATKTRYFSFSSCIGHIYCEILKNSILNQI